MMSNKILNVFAVDVGNTHCHYGLLRGDAILATGRCATAELYSGTNPFRQWIEQHANRVDSLKDAAYCSVVPAVNGCVEQALLELGLACFHLQSNSCPGLRIAYPKPQEIGEDRLANALAADALYGAPVVVIDMGTAVTFDIVTRSGGYEGGIIAPGIAVMTRYLHEQTALLPELRAEELVDVPGGIGQSTIEAMRLGCSVGFSGMLAALLERVESELARRNESPVRVISTGGTMAFLSRDWMRRTDFAADLTLRGLAIAVMRSHDARD
jgi:type III pantothenate kinase